MSRRRDQPRWPRGTPVAPGGRGPGGGRFRDETPSVPGGGDWVGQLSSRIPGGEPEWIAGGSWGIRDIATLRQTTPVQIRNTRGEWDTIVEIHSYGAAMYRVETENDDQDSLVGRDAVRDTRVQRDAAQGIAGDGYGPETQVRGDGLEALFSAPNPPWPGVLRLTSDGRWQEVAGATRLTDSIALLGPGGHAVAWALPDELVTVRLGRITPLPESGGGDDYRPTGSSDAPRSHEETHAERVQRIAASGRRILVLVDLGYGDGWYPVRRDSYTLGGTTVLRFDDPDPDGNEEIEFDWEHGRTLSAGLDVNMGRGGAPGGDAPAATGIDPLIAQITGGDDGLDDLDDNALWGLAGDYGVERAGRMRWQLPFATQERRQIIADMRARGAVTVDRRQQMTVGQVAQWEQRQIELDRIARGEPAPAPGGPTAAILSTRQEYEDEVSEAIRSSLHEDGYDIRRNLIDIFHVQRVGDQWTDGDAPDILGDWLDEYDAAVRRRDGGRASEAIDVLAEYSGLDTAFAIRGQQQPAGPGGSVQTETARQLHDRFSVYDRPTIRYSGRDYVVTVTVYNPQRGHIELYVDDGGDGDVIRVDPDFQLQVVGRDGRPPRGAAPMPRREPRPQTPEQQLQSRIRQSADSELPGGAPAMREMLQQIMDAGLRYEQIPVTSELRRQVDAIWAFQDDDSGLEARVTSVSIYGGQMSVGGRVYDEHGREVGEFSRYATNDGEVHHSYFRLSPDIQGGGFTTRWFNQVLDGYKQQGFDHVTVSANIDVGGYTWSQWFDFADDWRARSFLENLRNEVDAGFRGTVTDETKAEIHELLVRIGRGEHVSARQVAMIGYAQRETGFPDEEAGRPVDRSPRALPTRPDGSPMAMWLGKRFLLGQSWSGILRL